MQFNIDARTLQREIESRREQIRFNQDALQHEIKEKAELLRQNRQILQGFEDGTVEITAAGRIVKAASEADADQYKRQVKELIKEYNELGRLERESWEQTKCFQQRVRIQQFERFPADQSLVGTRCHVCLDDIEVGRMMQRLNCEGHHVFCKGCVEGWFANHDTCPICRHSFA